MKNTALICIALYFVLNFKLFALPTGATVQSGVANIDASVANQLSIVNSNGAIIHWQDFSIGAGELTQFLQPSAQSSVLNRVTGTNLSEIYGTLNSNGNVILLNPNGILVGASGAINTAGFTASTLDITNDQFAAYVKGAAGLNFVGRATGSVKNLGSINALEGDINLIARSVVNSGNLIAEKGKVGLYAGTDVFLPTGGRALIRTGASVANGVGVGISNEGTIVAVDAELQTVGGNIYALAINNTKSASIRATGTEKRNGVVRFTAPDAQLIVGGEMKLNKADLNITAAKVGLFGNINITAGNMTVTADNSAGVYPGSGITVGGSGITVDGNVTFTGIGSDNGRTSSHGVVFSDSTLSTTGVGDITISGTGGFAETSNAHGIHIDATPITSAGGNLTLNGTGNLKGQNHGVNISANSQFKVLNAGNNHVIIDPGSINIVGLPDIDPVLLKDKLELTNNITIDTEAVRKIVQTDGSDSVQIVAQNQSAVKDRTLVETVNVGFTPRPRRAGGPVTVSTTSVTLETEVLKPIPPSNGTPATTPVPPVIENKVLKPVFQKLDLTVNEQLTLGDFNPTEDLVVPPSVVPAVNLPGISSFTSVSSVTSTLGGLVDDSTPSFDAGNSGALTPLNEIINIRPRTKKDDE